MNVKEDMAASHGSRHATGLPAREERGGYNRFACVLFYHALLCRVELPLTTFFFSMLGGGLHTLQGCINGNERLICGTTKKGMTIFAAVCRIFEP